MSKVEYDDRVLLDITSNDAFALAVVVVDVAVNITATVVVVVFVVVLSVLGGGSGVAGSDWTPARSTSTIPPTTLCRRLVARPTLVMLS